jgi:DNA-binding CsgD family transcriptional regulator
MVQLRAFGAMNKRLQAFLNVAGNAKTLPRLEAAMAAYCYNNQLAGFAFLGFPHSLAETSAPVHLSNYAAAWQDEYLSEALYQNDAVVLDAQKSRLPIIWSLDNINVRGKDAAAVFERAANYDIRSVCTIPIRDKIGRLSAITYASKDTLSHFQIYLHENLAFLHLAAAFLQANIERLTDDCTDQLGCTLTPRELCALKYASDGLQNKDIAQKLRISERTVTFHIDNAIHKLSANNRPHAVGRAIRLGLI